MLDLAIVILNYNTKDLTLSCLKSIFQNKWKVAFKVWVVDNASEDASVKEIKKKFPQVSLIESKKNLGYSRGNNLALKKVYQKAKYCLLLNSDTKLLPGSLDRLVEVAGRNGFDVASCKLLNQDKSFQPNVGDLPSFSPTFFWLSGLDDILSKLYLTPSFHRNGADYYKKTRGVGWVSGSVMLIRSTVFQKIGFFDDKIFMYAEDVDYCWRAKRKNLKVGWVKEAQIIHIGGASLDKPQESRWMGEFGGLLYLYKKNYGTLVSLGLKIFIYIFVALRIIAFFAIGRRDHAETYAKVITKI